MRGDAKRDRDLIDIVNRYISRLAFNLGDEATVEAGGERQFLLGPSQ